MIDIDRTPIVEIGAVQIVYGEVACDPSALASKPLRLRGKSVEAACWEQEQWLFRFRFCREVISQAFTRENCELTDADIAPFRRTASLAQSDLRAAAEKTYVLPRALRRVYAGEQWQNVWSEDVRDSGSTFEDFRAASRLWPTADSVDRYLSQDALARLLESFERQAQEEAAHAIVKRMLEQRAIATGSTFEAVAEEYMRELMRTLPVKLLDQRFRLPAGWEVFQ